IAGDIELSAKYIAPEDAYVTAKLDYQTQAGSTVDLEVKYEPTDTDLKLILSDTVHIEAGDNLLLKFNDGTDTTEINVVFDNEGYYDIGEIAAEIDAFYGSHAIKEGTLFLKLNAETQHSLTANIMIELDNETSKDYTLTFGGSLAGPLGFSSVSLLAYGGGPTVEEVNTITKRYEGDLYATGSTLTDVGNDLNSKLTSEGFSAQWVSTSVTGGTTGHMEIKKVSGNVKLAIEAVFGPGQLEYDLGLSGGSIAAADPVNTTLSGDEIIESVTTTGIDIGGKNLADTAKALQDELTALNTTYSLSGTDAFDSDIVELTTGTPAGTGSLTFDNSSIYSITFKDKAEHAIEELFGNSTLMALALAPVPTEGTSVYTGGIFESSSLAGNNMTQIADQLNNEMRAFLGAGWFDSNYTFDFFEYNSVDDTITLKNGIGSGYKITIPDTTSEPLDIGDAMWKANTSLERVADAEKPGKTPTITGNVAGPPLTLAIAGMDIYEAFLYIESTLASPAVVASNPELAGLTVSWVTDPYDTTPTPYGQLRLTNATGLQIKIKQLGSDQGDTLNAKRWLFDGGDEFTIASADTKESRNLQARDRDRIEINWEGNRADGAVLSSNKNGALAWVWEGEDLKDESLARVRSAVSTTEIKKLFDGTSAAFYIGENNAVPPTLISPDSNLINRTTFPRLKTNDSWILFTNAAVAGTADTLKIDLYDGGVFAVTANNGGVSNNITYNFTDGALDNKTALINQMVRTGRGVVKYDTLTHNIEFGSIGASDAVFRYGQRIDAGDPDEWEMGSGVKAWYGQAYYGNDATYYFQSGAAPSSIIQDIEVDRQNDVNATLLFKYDGTQLTVDMKGYARTDASAQLTDSQTFDAAKTAALQSGGPLTLTIGGLDIKFTQFQVNASALAAGDKFVVNVAAAAKLDAADVNKTPATSAFSSNVNIAIDGDPLTQKDPDKWGTAMQYRFADGKVDGETLNLLGFVVDPENGYFDAQGVGWYGGELELKDFNGGGYAADSGVGTPGGVDDLAYWIRAEINNQGEAEPVASALVTSAYFQKMENDKTKTVKDFVAAVGYSDYLYGVRSDGTYGPMNEPGYEAYNPYNASLIFDVLEAVPGVLTFRVQGHVMDLDGKYWYVEDENVQLNTGANTSKDSTIPTPPADVANPVLLFEDSAFGGLYFDEFTLAGADLWTAGDRFTLSLTASGRGDPNIDELNLFSDRRGTNMPHSFRFNDGVLDNGSIDLRVYQLANNLSRPDSDKFTKDQVMDGTLSLSFGEYFPSVAGEVNVRSGAEFQTVYREGIDAGVAHFYSKTQDVAQFWDKSGRFLLANGPEILTIRQEDREASVAIGAGIELGYLARAISEQILRSLIVAPAGREQMVSGDDKYDIFGFVNTAPGQSSKESVVGTFLAHSVLPGEDSALKFYGSEDLMKAFSFNTIQRAEDDLFDLDVRDAHTGKAVSSMKNARAGELAYGLIAPGLALDVNAVIGVKRAVYDARSGTFTAEVQQSFEQFIHLADSALRLQIGANEGENTILVLGDMTAGGLGVKNLDVRGRESASRSITIVDNAIDKVSTQRASVGSQINRLEHTITNLTVADENLTAAESRIRDADMAREMMNFTKLQIMLQAGISMSAQANALPQNVLNLLSRETQEAGE
ncbi:MAG: hypothetical protein LBS00_04800, partial [Synergistaceae bacterium]|nr:hypothetical protein [Synergistaceae bacterium]